MAENGGELPYFRMESPMKIMDGIKYASIGYGHYAAVSETEELFVWGDNTSGALGDGSGEYRREPYSVMNGIRFVECGIANIIVVDNNGDVWELGAH